MNTRFRTAKPLQIYTFVLLMNQEQGDGVSEKLLPLKTGPYLIIDKPTDTTYILQDQKKNHNSPEPSSTILPKRKTYKRGIK